MTAVLNRPAHAIDARTRAIAAVARVANGFRAFARSIVNRRQVNRLALMSDRQLADIGLARGDLMVAMRAPLGVDPTAQLSHFASERHRNAERRAG